MEKGTSVLHLIGLPFPERQMSYLESGKRQSFQSLYVRPRSDVPYLAKLTCKKPCVCYRRYKKPGPVTLS